MRRDIAKAIEEYKQRYSGKNGKEAAFFISDTNQIMELSADDTPGNMLYNIIFNSLEAGFMIGYRKAQRDARKNSK